MSNRKNDITGKYKVKDSRAYLHNSHHFNSTLNEITPPSEEAFLAINTFHNINMLAGTQKPQFQKGITHCTAVELALFLIDAIRDADIRLDKNDSFPDEFYQTCVDDLTKGEYPYIGDDDALTEIYLKQLINIMRSAELIKTAGMEEIFVG